MAKYRVWVFCDDCAEPHLMPPGLAIERNDLRESALNDITDGIALPADLAHLAANEVPCPKTGRMYTQKDNGQVFLVRIA